MSGGQQGLEGGNGDDTLLGGHGSDYLRGNEGDDRLKGQGGNDTIIGRSGNDFLHGDTGRDLLDASQPLITIDDVRIDPEGDSAQCEGPADPGGEGGLAGFGEAREGPGCQTVAGEGL